MEREIREERTGLEWRREDPFVFYFEKVTRFMSANSIPKRKVLDSHAGDSGSESLDWLFLRASHCQWPGDWQCSATREHCSKNGRALKKKSSGRQWPNMLMRLKNNDDNNNKIRFNISDVSTKMNDNRMLSCTFSYIKDFT